LSDRQLLLTRTGLQRIEDELRHLQGRRREVAEQLRDAKGFGDVTENAEYEQAKTEQAMVEGRIAELKGVLASAHMIDDAEIPTDRASIGSVVKLRDCESHEVWELTLVGSYEADPEDDRISVECPIGAALLGRVPGEIVEAQVPAGTARYELLSIRRQDQ
jgi:transcription elongation factor GreA